jgi:hypothetical protein
MPQPQSENFARWQQREQGPGRVPAQQARVPAPQRFLTHTLRVVALSVSAATMFTVSLVQLFRVAPVVSRVL